MSAMLLWCIVGYLADCGIKDEAKALSFPEEVSVNNYIKLTSAIPKPLTAVSVCAWIKKSLDPRVQHMWFSYAVPSNDNEITLSDWRRNYIANIDNMEMDDVVLLKNEWYHVCLTWSASTGKMDYYVNGVLVKSKGTSASTIRSGGILILGQDQDSYGGSFDVNQAFGGDLYQVNVFSRKLLLEDIGAMYYDGRCSQLASSLVHDIVISWKDILGAHRNGAVQVTSAECNPRTDRTFLDKVTKLVLEELSTSNN